MCFDFLLVASIVFPVFIAMVLCKQAAESWAFIMFNIPVLWLNFLNMQLFYGRWVWHLLESGFSQLFALQYVYAVYELYEQHAMERWAIAQN